MKRSGLMFVHTGVVLVGCIAAVMAGCGKHEPGSGSRLKVVSGNLSGYDVAIVRDSVTGREFVVVTSGGYSAAIAPLEPSR